jgi:hypothetical protein
MLLHTRSLVGSIIDTRESSFRKRQYDKKIVALKMDRRQNIATRARPGMNFLCLPFAKLRSTAGPT